jgi:hypothetical protein
MGSLKVLNRVAKPDCGVHRIPQLERIIADNPPLIELFPSVRTKRQIRPHVSRQARVRADRQVYWSDAYRTHRTAAR